MDIKFAAIYREVKSFCKRFHNRTITNLNSYSIKYLSVSIVSKKFPRRLKCK